MKTVSSPDGIVTIDFPDEMSDSEIGVRLNQAYLEKTGNTLNQKMGVGSSAGFAPPQPIQSQSKSPPMSEQEVAILDQAGIPLASGVRVAQPGVGKGLAVDPLSMMSTALGSIPVTWPKFLSQFKLSELIRGKAAKAVEETLKYVPKEEAPSAIGQAIGGAKAGTAQTSSPSESERIKGAAILLKDGNIISTYGRAGHQEVWNKLTKQQREMVSDASGWVTNKGRYVTTKEAQSLLGTQETSDLFGREIISPKVAPPTSYTLSESDKLVNSAESILASAPTKSTSERFKDYTKSINLESPSPKSAIPKSEEGKVKGIIRGLNEELGHPYQVMQRNPKMFEIWDMSDKAHRAKAISSISFWDDFTKNVPMKEGSPESAIVGDLLNKYESWSHIPAIEQATYSPEIRKTFEWFRSKWDDLGNALESAGRLPPEQRIKNYFFRVFDKDKIYKAWKDEREALLAKMSHSGLDKVEAIKDKEKLARLNKSIDKYENEGTILYDYLPKELTAPFLKQRLGGEGYSLDVVRAMKLYKYYYDKVIYDSPILAKAAQSMKQMSAEDKNYTVRYLREYLGYNKENPSLEWASKAITSLEYAKDMWFNPRSAITNASQLINTLVEIGPKYTAEGVISAFKPEIRKKFFDRGHMLDVPDIYYQQVHSGIRKVNDAGMYLFNKVELANRLITWSGAYEKGLAKGMLPQMAEEFAEGVVRDTMFTYGKTGTPLGLRGPIARVAGQYGSYPIGQIELFTKWAKNNPAKLVAYLAVANGMTEGLKELGGGFGVDVSNILGIGVNVRELTRAVGALGKGNIDDAKIHAKMGLPVPIGQNVGTGVLPSGLFPSIQTLTNLYNTEWDRTIPPTTKRLIESGGALAGGEKPIPILEGQPSTKKGYQIKDIKTGDTITYSSPIELFTRTFVARPSSETEQVNYMKYQKEIDRIIAEKVKDAADLYFKGKNEEANKLVDSYGLSSESLKTAINSKFMKSQFTPKQLMELKIKLSKTKTGGRLAITGEVMP